MFLKKIFIILSLIIFTLSCNYDNCLCSDCRNVFLDYSTTVKIIYIVDGDTFDFDEQGEQVRIRLLNVDCFEVKRTSRLTEQAAAAGISIDSALSLGLQAKEYATGLLLNNEVTIKRDSTEPNFDVYGRLLRVSINTKDYASLLIENGFNAPN